MSGLEVRTRAAHGPMTSLPLRLTFEEIRRHDTPLSSSVYVRCDRYSVAAFPPKSRDAQIARTITSGFILRARSISLLAAASEIVCPMIIRS
jgi:hypothetical protein